MSLNKKNHFVSFLVFQRDSNEKKKIEDHNAISSKILKIMKQYTLLKINSYNTKVV